MTPLVLIPSGNGDGDFVYATRFDVESALYIRFAEGDDVLVAGPLEFDRARAESKVARVIGFDEAGFEDIGPFKSWARLVSKLLRARGLESARVSPRLQAAYLEELRATGLGVEVDRDLFVAERRRKSKEEAAVIRESQQAAEAAVVEIVSQLAQADVRDGVLWLGGKPLTSERLFARAQMLLGEAGFVCPDMIIAGSPDGALPHFRGAGPIRANAPVIIDVFPQGRTSHYYGDLTRTVVVGDIPDEIRRMHAAVVQALDAGEESIRAGVTGRDVHLAVCQVLVDRGYATVTTGYEGADGVPTMNHGSGHGVGLDVHEEPRLSESADEALAEGDVVTVEPGLYRLGLGGVRVEDMGMVTKDGFENFTRISRSLDPKDYL
jgi:Xaa-Pro aminopeptidase